MLLGGSGEFGTRSRIVSPWFARLFVHGPTITTLLATPQLARKPARSFVPTMSRCSPGAIVRFVGKV